MNDEANRRNILAIRDFTQKTRELVDILDKKVGQLEAQLRIQKEEINMYKQQISNLQQKLYQKGV